MSTSKDKGTRAETAVVRFLGSLTWPNSDTLVFPDVERRALSGTEDRGDVAGIPRTVIQVKDVKKLNLTRAFRDTLKQRTRANADMCMLVVKRPYKPVHQWDAYRPKAELGFHGAFFPEGDEWVRMDLGAAIADIALQTGLECP